MPDEPHNAILDRLLFRTQIGESFAAQISLLEQIVNYGTNLILRCFNSSEKKIPETVTLISFLKHGVTNLDAIHLLSREGAALSCFPHIRSLFEIDLYLRWIFQEDYELRGTAYFVWNIRKKRYWLRCYLEGTNEYAANVEHMSESPGESYSIPYTQEELRKAIDHENERLAKPEVAEVNEMFDRCMNNSGKDQEWYKPFRVNSIRDMAIRLGDEWLYKIFYTRYSRAVHGLSMERQFHFNASKRKLVFDHIRTFQSIDEIFRMTFNYAVKIYRLVLERYRPGELDAFKNKYESEWRDSFWSIPKVTKNGSTFDITPAVPRCKQGDAGNSE